MDELVQVLPVDESQIWEALAHVMDPEIPVLSVIDMGMITKVEVRERDEHLSITSVSITMTPTFVGCPAIDVIKRNIATGIEKLGISGVEVIADMETSWDSNRMTTDAKDKLERFGIAPPITVEGELNVEMLDRVRCPHCQSTDTTLRSAFGSTLCRAIRFCFSCKQGFEQFKPLT